MIKDKPEMIHTRISKVVDVTSSPYQGGLTEYTYTLELEAGMYHLMTSLTKYRQEQLEGMSIHVRKDKTFVDRGTM